MGRLETHHDQVEAVAKLIVAEFDAVAKAARDEALEKAADFVFKNWDSKVSVAISDALRAMKETSDGTRS